jgi:hypothetical protein
MCVCVCVCVYFVCQFYDVTLLVIIHKKNFRVDWQHICRKLSKL